MRLAFCFTYTHTYNLSMDSIYIVYFVKHNVNFPYLSDMKRLVKFVCVYFYICFVLFVRVELPLGTGSTFTE